MYHHRKEDKKKKKKPKPTHRPKRRRQRQRHKMAAAYPIREVYFVFLEGTFHSSPLLCLAQSTFLPPPHFILSSSPRSWMPEEGKMTPPPLCGEQKKKRVIPGKNVGIYLLELSVCKCTTFSLYTLSTISYPPSPRCYPYIILGN